MFESTRLWHLAKHSGIIRKQHLGVNLTVEGRLGSGFSEEITHNVTAATLTPPLLIAAHHTFEMSHQTPTHLTSFNCREPPHYFNDRVDQEFLCTSSLFFN